MGNEASQAAPSGKPVENDVEVRWRKVEGGMKEEEARDGHCSSATDSQMFVFGGVCQSADGESHETNQLLSLNTESSTWRVVEAKGDTPAPRASATMAAVGSSLYVFGGLSQDCGWFDDVHKFDTNTSTWTRLEAEGQAPSPRDKLASAVVEDRIYIFGGFGPQNTDEDDDDEEWEDEEDGAPQDQQAAQFGWFDELYMFDTSCNKWSQPLQMNLGGPTPRAAHAMCAVNKYLCIFGGRDSKTRLNDLHIFNTESRKWEKPPVQGCAPAPRSFHTASTVGQRVVVLGGRGNSNQHFKDVNIFDVETMQWLQPGMTGEVPTARGQHSAAVVNKRLVVYGGSSDFHPETMQCMTYHNDTFYINTDDLLRGAAIESGNEENISDNITKSSDQGCSEVLKPARTAVDDQPIQTNTT